MSECIEWDGARNNKGYGVRRDNGKVQLVHRLVWAEENGQIPEDMCVLHRCDNPPCINIDHLFIGFSQDNTLDMYRKGRQKPHGEAKLDTSKVQIILASKESSASLGRRFGTSRQLIAMVRRREIWKEAML